MSESRQGLAGTLALLAATTATLFLLALLDDTPPSGTVADPGSSLDPERLLQIGIQRTPAVASRVEQIRGLRFDRVLQPRVSDVADLRRIAERELKRPDVRRALRVDEVQLRLLGLLEDDESLRQVSSDYTALAAAYYDPRRKSLFLVGDAVPAGPGVTEFVLAHELTHALEDQSFGLPRAQGAGDDASLAGIALQEGSATAVMQVYATRHLDAFELIAETALIETGDIELPEFAEAQAEFTYNTGAAFVDELRRYAKGWGIVDLAFGERPPATTEQIMHPEKYIAGEPAMAVPIPAKPGPGWVRSDAGTIGEWATRQLLIEGEPGLGAATGAAGWGGDRYALFTRNGASVGCVTECTGDHAMALHWRYDGPAEAKELTRQLRTYAEQLGDGWASVRRFHSRVGLGLGPNEGIAADLAQPR